MTRKSISTPSAPAAIGPYVQAVLRDGWLYASGQIALDADSGELVGAGTDEVAARTQTQKVLQNLGAVLEAAGGAPADVVKCTVFLADLGHFGVVNEVYAEFFGLVNPPARACVEVSRLPRDVLVEIDCIARITGSPPASGDWSLESPSLADA
jgi:2-iminobutanoate/2-iminopropanoate deaminase